MKKVVETEVYGSPQLPRSASLAYCLARSASPSRDHGEIGTNHDRYIVKKKRGEGSLVRSNAISWSTATRTGGLVNAIPHIYVFPATRTGYVSKERTFIQQTKKAEEEVIKKSGVDFSAHDLRRTSTTLLGEAGSNVYQIKAALNHASDGRDVTERHYMRIRLKALRSVFERLEESILEEAGVRQPEPDGLAELISLLKSKASDPAAIAAIKAALEASSALDN